MDWKRRKQITNLVNGILECNVLARPPIELIGDIMKRRGIIFEDRDEDDDEFCGVYIEIEKAKIIFVNANLYPPRKNFTIAHELGHHFLAHPLQDGAIICNTSVILGNDKPEIEKEADYFAACLLMPQNLMKQKKREFDENCHSGVDSLHNTGQQEQTDALIKYLCQFFQVSKEAMGYRLEALKMI